MVTVGETLSHYRILEELGHGGMGVVYRARDEHLPRDVALKVLPAGLFSDETARSRFRREAHTISQLNHPNIAVVFDFDRENDVDFLAMEFVDGQTLAAKVAAGPLPEKEVIALGTQIAEALDEAHEHGIIHRDLKPGNVMVTAKGRAKVLDFGLAKLTGLGTRGSGPGQDAAATASLAETQGAAVMGTVPYMAPEQLQGKPADARADIYALGAVLYEMATGQRPFPEKQSTPLIASILTEPPQPPRELNGQVSQGLEAIILKALEKNPDARYQSAKEVLKDLGQVGVPGSVVGARRRVPARRWALAAAIFVITLASLFALNVGGLRDRVMRSVGAIHESPLQIRSIAVLPLENLSGDPQQEYFADGMTEELITNLAKISSLKVISRISVMQYKGTRKPAAQIAKELNVDGLIEGSVLREGGQVRITAQLIQASTDQHLWAEGYQRDLRSVLVLQSEIASTIADKVRAAVTPSERSRLASARAVNPEAYDAYLKGRLHWYKFTPQEVDTALKYFELASKKDPNYAPAYVGIGYVWAARTGLGFISSREALPKVKGAALKALELDDTLADAHEALADVTFFYEWNWPAAEKEYKRAIELNPNYADLRIFYTGFLDVMRRPQEATEQIQRALELDPLNPYIQAMFGQHLWISRQYDDAIAQWRKTLAMQPDSPDALYSLSCAYHRKGMYEEALAETKKNYVVLGRPEVVEALDRGYAQGGYPAAMRLAAQTLASRSSQTSVPTAWIVELYMKAGEKDRALEWLEKGLEVREFSMPSVNVDPTYDTLRSDPRFQDLLRRMNFPQ